MRPGGGGVHLRVRDEGTPRLGLKIRSIFIFAVVIAAAAPGRMSRSSTCARESDSTLRPDGDDGGGLDALVDPAVAP